MVNENKTDKETKEWKFGNWVREHSRGIAIGSIIGISGLFVGYEINGLFVGYEINKNAQQNIDCQQQLVGVLEKVVMQDPNKAKVLLDNIKPKELVKEETSEIKKEAKYMTQAKYILILEEHRELRKGNDALTAERNTLKQQYNALGKEQAPLKEELDKTLKDYKVIIDAKTALEAKQKELTKQVADMNDVATKLTGENNKMNKAYVALAEAKKIADANSVEATAKLTTLDKKYQLLTEERAKLEKDVLRITLNYNSVLEQAVSRSRSLSPSESGKDNIDLSLRQVNRFRNTPGLEIVFFEGSIDGAEKVNYERTNLYGDKELRDRMLENRNYAFLFDFNGDGKKDLFYNGDKIGEDKLKEGRANETFAPAKTIPNKTALQILGRYILKKDLGINIE